MENPTLALQPPQADISFATADLPRWQRKTVRTIEKVVGKKRLLERYHEFLATNDGPEEFWDDVAQCLQLSVSCFSNGPATVPQEGPLVVVANHPYGVVDGAAICWLLSQRRKDFKVILWDVFSKEHKGENYFLPLDLAEDCKQARRQNLKIRKTAIEHLREDKSILIFPSGSVERSTSFFGKPAELPWLRFTEKLILASGASALPVFVHGHNSTLFHMASHCSETLRRAMFFSEINRKISSEIELSVGELIDHDELVGSDHDIMAYLRDKTMCLSATRETGMRNRLLELDG